MARLRNPQDATVGSVKRSDDALRARCDQLEDALKKIDARLSTIEATYSPPKK